MFFLKRDGFSFSATLAINFGWYIHIFNLLGKGVSDKKLPSEPIYNEQTLAINSAYKGEILLMNNYSHSNVYQLHQY